jgi:aryl-alcohol dehydrogenase-like predicted oxidoreductase
MRLVIGGAQIGMSYGIFNDKKVSKKAIIKIKKIIKKSNINHIDTASSYGVSEKIIGENKLNKLNIITKIKLPIIPKKNINEFVNKSIKKSLNNLKVKKIQGLLVHDYRDLIGDKGQIFLASLKELKKKKIIKSIGLSIYDPSDLEKIWKFWKPDLVQAPLNIFDQRIIKSGWVNTLKKFNVKIFIRSCFLQGLLIGNQNSLQIPKKHRELLISFNKWCEKKKISRIKACLHFVKQFKKIDFVLVGFNSPDQLSEILYIFNQKNTKITKSFFTNELNLIDPRKWHYKKKNY